MSLIEGLFGLLIGVVVLMAVVLLAICWPAQRRHRDSSAGDAGSGMYVGDSSPLVHSGHSGHSDHGCVSHDGGGFSDSCSSDSGGGHF